MSREIMRSKTAVEAVKFAALFFGALFIIAMLGNEIALGNWLKLVFNEAFLKDARTVSTAFITSTNPRIRIDNDDIPHITWEQREDSNGLVYVKLDENILKNHKGKKYRSKNSYVSKNLYGDGNIFFDSNGYPQIYWSEKNKTGFIYFDGETWRDISGDEYHFDSKFYGTDIYDVNVKKDRNDEIFFIWDEYFRESDQSTGSDIMLAKWNGNHLVALDGKALKRNKWNVNVTDSSSNSSSPSLFFDLNNNPFIIWLEDIKHETKFLSYLKLDEGVWKTISGEIYNPATMNSKIDVGLNYITEISTEIDSHGTPHIAILGGDSDDQYVNVYYLKLDLDAKINTYPSKVDLPEEMKVNKYCEVVLKIDGDDQPHILLETEDKNYFARLKLFYLNEGEWKTIPSDENKNVFEKYRTEIFEGNFDFDVDSKGYPHVVFCLSNNYHFWNLDTASSRIGYLRWDGESWVTVKGKKY